MSDLAWMPLYIGDEAAVTGHLTAEEFGAYERLRRHFWQHGSLPDDQGRLARITGVDPDRWPAVREAIEELVGDAMTRLSQQRATAEEKRERKVAAGKKGAQSRWGNAVANGTTNAVANGKGIADAMRLPMRNQWPPAPAPDEVRYEEGLVLTRTRARDTEPTEYPIDPPETVEEGRTYLQRKGVKPDELEAKLTKLMAFRLYPSEVEA